MKARRTTTLALLTGVALVLFLVEAQIPPLIFVPGVKIGLANIVTVFTVFYFCPKDGILVLFSRILLGAAFAGNGVSLIYSAAGGLAAILTTILLKQVLHKNQLWIAGCLGAIAHVCAQCLVAIPLSGATFALICLIYLPVLLVCGIITGTFTGLCAQVLVNRGDRLWKTIFR